MPERITTRRTVLVASLGMLALIVVCGWGGWQASQPEERTFLLPQAREVRRERVSAGRQHIAYVYEGKRSDQRVWVQQRARERGWRRSTFLEECEGRCSGESTRVYVRRLFFGLFREIALVDQHGDGPFEVRVVFQRCVRLPYIGCWP